MNEPSLLTSEEAARVLGVSRATLYAYVSRGLIESIRAVDGRTSRFRLDDIQDLAAKGRPRPRNARNGGSARIVSSITRVDELGPAYRDRPVDELIGRTHFEDVARLLWSGTLDDAGASPTATWPADRTIVSTIDAIAQRQRLSDTDRLRLAVVLAVGANPLRSTTNPQGIIDNAGALIATAAATVCRESFGAEPNANGRIAHQLARHFCSSTGLDDALVADLATVIDALLVSLADHGIAASTFAVRVAASTRADAYSCVLAGLGAMSGHLHGGASAQVTKLLSAADPGTDLDLWATTTVGEHLDDGKQLPGFGHTIYASTDPRYTRLLTVFRSLAFMDRTADRLDALTAAAQKGAPVYPNIDLAIGGLCHAARLPQDAGVTIFTIARMVGWFAHIIEEYGERPLRFRPRGVYAEPASP